MNRFEASLLQPVFPFVSIFMRLQSNAFPTRATVRHVDVITVTALTCFAADVLQRLH